MKKLAIILFSMCCCIIYNSVTAQNNTLYHFQFKLSNRALFNEIASQISIDNVINDSVYAYANQKEFNAFLAYNIAYSLIDDSKASKAVSMATSIDQMSNWDKYPTYDLYVEMMELFASDYSHICKLETIGTLASGRKLLAIQITDNPNNNFEPEPNVFFSSSMHGDETGGYPIMLRLIDYLLSNYNNNAEITHLINNSRIFINPLANPNGTYTSDNNTVSAATRYNAKNIDINRNFPDPAAGEHPDGNIYQEETEFFMDFAEKHKFHIGLNIHGGVEVINYPWDTWSKLSADDAWWRYVGGNYRDSAQANSPAGYLTDISNGLTNGYQWYRITGGRQDYMNYFHGTREFTLEISGTKLYPSSSLPYLWNYNKSALLAYLNESLNGIQGTSTNTDGKPIKAYIELINYDKDNSQIYSDSTNGFYARYLKEGSYNMKVSADGYSSKYYNIEVKDNSKTQHNILLGEQFHKICLNSSSISKEFYDKNSDSISIDITNCGNDSTFLNIDFKQHEHNAWLKIKTKQLTLAAQEQGNIVIFSDTIPLTDTTIYTELLIKSNNEYTLPIVAKINAHNNLFVQTQSMYFSNAGTTRSDSILVVNKLSQHQYIILESYADWLSTTSSSKKILANDSTWVSILFNCTNLKPGLYNTHVLINDIAYPIKTMITNEYSPEPSTNLYNFEVLKGGLTKTTFDIYNKGNKLLSYSLSLSDTTYSFVKQSNNLINKNDTQIFEIYVKSDSLELGSYTNQLNIESNETTTSKTFSVRIDTLPQISCKTDTIKIKCNIGEKASNTIRVSNIGGGKLTISIMEESNNFTYLLSIPNKINAIAAKHFVDIPIVVDASNLNKGNYIRMLLVNNIKIPVHIQVINKAILLPEPNNIVVETEPNEQQNHSLKITNTGDETIHVNISKLKNSPWLTIDKETTNIAAQKSVNINLSVNAQYLPIGEYFDKISLKTNDANYNIPVYLTIAK